jgi:hypothetical protein
MRIRTVSFLGIAILLAGEGSIWSAQASPGRSPGPTPAPSTTPADHVSATPPASGASIPINALTPDMLTRLEIFLDSHSFGPGKIDGKALPDTNRRRGGTLSRSRWIQICNKNYER